MEGATEDLTPGWDHEPRPLTILGYPVFVLREDGSGYRVMWDDEDEQ